MATFTCTILKRCRKPNSNYLGKTTRTIFAEDFDQTVMKLAGFQADTAAFPMRDNLIVLDGCHKTLQFSQKIFEEQKGANNRNVNRLTCTVLYTYSFYYIPATDTVTERPIPSQYCNAFDDIKSNFCAVPLPVFCKGKPVHVSNVESVISTALIEIQFELCHFTISS